MKRTWTWIGSGMLAVALAALIPNEAAAATDPAARCLDRQLGATASYARRLLSLQGAAARTGRPIDPARTALFRDRLASGFARAEDRGGCAVTGAAAVAADEVDRVVAEVVARLTPAAGEERCASRKLRAAGARVRSLLRAHAVRLRTGDAGRVGAAAARAASRFDLEFQRAEGAGACPVLASAGDVIDQLDPGIDMLLASLGMIDAATFWISSAAQPANTPGTPGVVVTHPDLITQFGGAGFDLNRAGYTRWRLRGPDRTPDAILVVVAGFGGGANNFKILAENLMTRIAEDHGVLLEVWGFHRRSNQLEDRAGVRIAEQVGDATVAVDWYYGAEMNLPLSPELAPLGRRAFFYNATDDIPFLANWNTHVMSRDIDAVVRAARGVARNGNVFLGGHSAGTGFTARYAATDFEPTGAGPADPGFARLRGLVLFEGGGGSTGAPLSGPDMDRIEARFDGGLFGAVRDGAPRCVDGTTPCTVPTEATDCAGQTPPLCITSVSAYSAVAGLGPEVTAASEAPGLQSRTDPDGGQAVVQAPLGPSGETAVGSVPALLLLNALLQPGTVFALYGQFLDDESIGASFSPAIATAMGNPGPVVGGLLTWPGIVATPLPPEPDNGPPPTTLPAGVWGQEREVVRIDRYATTFLHADTNAADWYYAASGLFLTSPISLDSTPLSVGRGRRDIVNLTQAASVDIPVISFGGSNGLVTVPGDFVPVGSAFGVCTAPSCDGATPRVVDAALPNPAFPTLGDVAGGFEVYVAEGFAHNDVVAAEDTSANPVIVRLSDFIARNAP